MKALEERIREKFIVSLVRMLVRDNLFWTSVCCCFPSCCSSYLSIQEVTMHNPFNSTSRLLSTIVPDFESITEDPDALLARELNRLSMQEREQVNYDVHGVAELMPEGSEFISTRLVQLELELAKITEKVAYSQALMQDPNFVKNRDFRIRFLRAGRFAAAEAAVRMVRHFQYKMELFGAGKMVKDIEIDDLDSEDIKVLESGFIQLLPVRDRAGRAIMCWNPILRKDAGIEQRVRVFEWLLFRVCGFFFLLYLSPLLLNYSCGLFGTLQWLPARILTLKGVALF
jgi:hypothetical protein